MSTTSDSLTARYGARAPLRRAVAVALAVLLIAPASAWLVWATVQHADPAVASQQVSHDIVADHTATVTFRIEYGDGPVPATCTARAIAHDKSLVGEVRFTPEPAQAQQTVEIATDRRATTVDWLGCTAEGQPRPR